MVLIASELAAAEGGGGGGGGGGPWRHRSPGDRPHGLDIIQALTGQDGWGTRPAGTGGRIVWAWLSW